MSKLTAILSIAITLGALSPLVFAAEKERHGDHMPDIQALHSRLHDHSSDGPRRQFDNDVIPVKTVEPRYPREALIGCRRGWVFLEFMITPEGEVEDVEILAQDVSKLFGRSAVAAIRKWRFEPAKVNGKPVPRGATLPLEFSRPGGCTEEPPPPHEQSLSGWADIPVRATSDVARAEIIVVPVVSAILGKPEGAFVHGQKWFSGDDLTLRFEAVADDLVFQLRPWEDIADRQGLTVQPENTRFARLLPIAESRGDKQMLMDAYFSDDNGRELILTYSDRAAVMKGTQEVRGTSVDYALQFPGPGFYWVEFVALSNGNYEVRRAGDVNGPHLVLAHQ